MAASSPLVATSTLVASSEISRRSANYHPSVWGDRFIHYASQSTVVDDNQQEQIKILKEEVRKMLVPATENSISKVYLIDLIQRLGVDYHFEHEIDQVLQYIHNIYIENGIITLKGDLYSVALLFRLLRQQGYRISPGIYAPFFDTLIVGFSTHVKTTQNDKMDTPGINVNIYNLLLLMKCKYLWLVHQLPEVFEKFKDEQGHISQRLSTDVEGMLSLYETAHLRVHGENILDEALAFTSTHLELMTTHLSPSLAAKINHSLRRPLRKSLPRLEAWHYIYIYQEDASHDETLLAFAKLDFNILQKLHQKEVGSISKWWKDLDFATKLPFARDRMVECYFWILGVYFEPCYSLARRITTKVICMASIIDDIYDVYGTLEELQLFTAAIERWDISCMDYLPEYMKFCYEALLNVYEEIEEDMTKEGRAFCVNYAKAEMKKLVRAYFEEAKWFNRNYTPTTEEYMSNALVSSGYPMVVATSFVGMGCIATGEVFKWATNDPKIIRASAIIARLMDDIVTHEIEQKTGDVASAIECYMKQHGATKQDAIDEFNRQVTSAWKDINEGCLEPTEVTRTFLMRVLNLSSVIDVLYTNEDCYTHSGEATKNNIEALLLKPLPI